MGFPGRMLLIACSERAWLLQRRLCEKIKTAHPETETICKVKCKGLELISEKMPLTECVGDYFSRVDAIVFLCAAGIAVRSIAPYLVHKSEDPAVVVLDEAGDFCISLLSGHWGGANALAEELADMVGATAVVTTATDRAHKFAVDVFAAHNNLVMTDWKLAKKISAAILAGERIPVISELPLEAGQCWPEELEEQKLPKAKEQEQLMAGAQQASVSHAMVPLGIYIGAGLPEQLPFTEVLHLIPSSVMVGIGCRKGTEEAAVAAAVMQCIKEHRIDLRAVEGVASIDLKKEEAGILAFSEGHQLPFVTFSSDELLRVQGSEAASDFVQQITGVPNVCERSALAASGGELIAGKKVYGKVTLALAERKRSLTIL